MLRCLVFIGIWLISLLPLAWGQVPSEGHKIAEIERKKNEPKLYAQQALTGLNYDVTHYRCEWTIDPQVRYIRGKVRVSFRSLSDTLSRLSLDLSNALTVDSVYFRGQKKAFLHAAGGQLHIPLGLSLGPEQLDSVGIFYQGIPGQGEFGAFARQLHSGVPIIWTMSVPNSGSEWWPCKDNLADKADSADILVITPGQNRVASNGLLVAETELNGWKRYHWKHKYPIASYLIAVAVTNYVSFTNKVKLPSQAPGDSLPVVNMVYPESEISARNNLPRVGSILQYYDSLLSPYPFKNEKYGHAQFGWGGGMEHQTMSFMTNFSFNLQAHELAHQWFGDYITCRSWQDVWLNEGWATYMAALADRRFGTASFSNWLQSTQAAVRAQTGGSVWVADTTNANRIFDYRLTYQKGALLLHMLRWELGDSAFWAGTRNYLADPGLAYAFAYTLHFKNHLETASGRNLDQFFQQWFYGQGHPILNIPVQISGSSVSLSFNQNPSHPSVPYFYLKVPVRFKNNVQDSLIVFYPNPNQTSFQVDLNFVPTQVIFDPDRWLLARGNVSILTSTEENIMRGQKPLLFPNPARDFLSLHYPGSLQVQLIDLQGKIIWNKQLETTFEKGFSVRDLPPGMYTLRIRSEDRIDHLIFTKL